MVSGTGTDARATGSRAISTVSMGDPALAAGRRLSGVHDFAPGLDPRFYEVTVSITNTGTVDVGDLRYRRTMDWDIPPTAFAEFVTIQGLPASAVVATSDNGFAAGNPLQPTGAISAPENSNVTDNGPDDHGATFDFSFGGLAVGACRDFIIYCGANANEAEALEAPRAVGAEVCSLGQASGEGGARDDLNTFIFAFAGVGGVPIGGETPSVSTVASLMDGAPASLGAAAGDRSLDEVFGVAGLRAFITGAFSGSRLHPDADPLGADVTGYAITAGLDDELARNEGLIDSAIVGLGLGWSRFTADIHDGGSDAQGDRITLLAYGAATLAKDIRMDLTLGHSWGGLEGARLSGGLRVFANGKTDASDFALQGRAACDFAVPTGVAVPLAAGVAFSLDNEGTHDTLSVRTRLAF